MKPILAILALVALALAGCRLPWEPGAERIVGEVVYPSGRPARSALVEVVGGQKTFSSYDGTFHLRVPAGSDSVTVTARDGYDGRAYAETHSGGVRVPATGDPVRVRIVLDERSPI